MEHTFQLEMKDYLQFSKYITKTNPRLKRQRIIRVVVLPAIMVLDLYFLRLPPSIYLTLVSGGFALWVTVMQWATRQAIVNSVNMRVGSIGLFTAALTPAVLRVEGPVLESRVRWDRFVAITESPDQLLFMMGLAYGFLIPKSSFPDLEHAREFLETARAYHSGAALDPPHASATWPPPPRRAE